MKSIVLSSFVSAVLVFSSQASAHHAAAVLYHLDQQVTVEGVVTEFRLGNPHARIYMTVRNANGEESQWMAEGGSRTVLTRNGWTGDELHVGDAVTIIGNPSRNGSRVIHWEKVVLPDGTERWGEDVPEDSVLEGLRQRRR